MAHTKRFTPKLLALSVAAVIGGVQAAEQPTEKTEEQIETISVTGIRDSIIRSTELKRDADSVVDLITAEDVGKFPDDNVMESLKRITGIQVTMDETGEASSFTVRGISQNRVELNGRSLTGGEGEGRNANLSDIPSELIAGLEVIKSPTADMIEGSLGATINLKTARPLSKKKSLNVLNVTGKYGDNVDKVYSNITGIISRKWNLGDWGKFGVLVNATRNENWRSGDKFIFAGWKSDPDTKRCGAYNINNAGTAVNRAEWLCEENYYTPDSFTGLQFREKRLRESATATFQWRPSDASEYILDVAWLNKVDEQRRDTIKIHTRQPNGYMDIERVAPLIGDDGLYHAFSDITTTNYDVEFGDSLIRPVNSFTSDSAYLTGTTGQGQLKETERLTFGLKGRWDLDSMRLTSEFGYSESVYERHYISMGLNYWGGNALDERSHTLRVDEGEAYRPGGSTLSLDFTDPRLAKLEWTELDGSPKILNDPTTLRMGGWQDDGWVHEPREMSFRLDADIDLDFGLFKSIETGFRATENIMERTERFRFKCSRNNTWGATGPTANSYNAETDPSCEDPSVSTVDFMAMYPGMFKEVDGFWDMSGGVDLAPYLQLNNDTFFDNRALWNEATGFNEVGGYTYYPNEHYKLTENTAAAYVKANLEGEAPFDGYFKANFGVRGVYTDITSITTPGTDVTNVTEVEDSHDYVEWLPSMNIAVTFDELQVRLAAAKVMVRPTFDQLKPTGSFNEFTGCSVYDPTGQTSDFPNTDLSYQEQALQIAQKEYLAAGIRTSNDPCPGIRNFGSNNVGTLDLSPYTAENYDLSFEYYWGEGSSANITFFYRDVKADIVRERAIFAMPADPEKEAYGLEGYLTTDYSDDFQEGDELPYQNELISTVPGQELWWVREFKNGGESTRYGVEIAYTQFLDMLPGAWGGLGFALNYTYSDGERPDPVLIHSFTGGESDGQAINFSADEYNGYDVSTYEGQLAAAEAVLGTGAYELQDVEALQPIEKMSEHSGNAALFYDKYGFNARLSYNYRSEYYVGLWTAADVPQYRDSTEKLDFSSGYKVSNNLTVRFNVNNILRQKVHNYYVDPSISQSVQYSDRIYTLGISAKF